MHINWTKLGLPAQLMATEGNWSLEHTDVPDMNTNNINEYTYTMGLKQTWEIGRFSRKIRRYIEKTLINSQKLNSESTHNILLNEAV